MSAQYWIARYVEDTFRNEPRNVGVFVIKNGMYASKFFGELDNGVLDKRKLKGLKHPSVYSQWRLFWLRKFRALDIKTLTSSSTANYSVVYGGEVTDTGDDNAAAVCRFLYNLLVGGGPIPAFEWDEEHSNTALASEIIRELDKIALLEKAGQLYARHPIKQSVNIVGASVVHTPSFSQRNGYLSVMEYIDLGTAQINKAKERAGWMGYMYRDIKDAEEGCETFSLIRPAGEAPSDQIEFAKKVLSAGSTIINWADEKERSSFIAARRRTAEPLLDVRPDYPMN